MNLKLKSFIYSLVVLFMFSCETLDINPKDNPNALTPDAINADLLLNSVQFGILGTFNALSDEGSQVTRMTHMFGPLYNNAYTPVNLDGEWTTIYAGVLADVEALLPVAEQNRLFTHVAVAKIAKAYAYTTLVDYFNDVPFSEAIQGVSGNLNPKRDAAADVYAAAETLLNEAITELNKTVEITGGTDLFYGGTLTSNNAKWIKVANTLKFRMYVQTRLVDAGAAAKAQALANDASLISTASDDFAFQYGTNLANPDSRSPLYSGNYDNGATAYQSLGYMARFTTSSDPRLRYYFYRQETRNTTDVNEKRCVTQSKPAHFAASDVFCQISGGYWGRDHGDDAGIPPDNLLRTIPGVYPAGGKFDYSQDTRGRQISGGQGQGIAPIMLSSFVDMLRAEAALTMGTGEDARALLEKGMRASIAKVISFGTLDPEYTSPQFDLDGDDVDETTPQQVFEPTAATIDTYVNNVLTSYDAAGANQLDIIVTELYKAAYGSGTEAYNAYRRTGYPSGMQPTLTPQPGVFPNTFFYAAVYVNTNSNATQRTFGEKVFWQTLDNLK